MFFKTLTRPKIYEKGLILQLSWALLVEWVLLFWVPNFLWLTIFTQLPTIFKGESPTPTWINQHKGQFLLQCLDKEMWSNLVLVLCTFWAWKIQILFVNKTERVQTSKSWYRGSLTFSEVLKVATLFYKKVATIFFKKCHFTHIFSLYL